MKCRIADQRKAGFNFIECLLVLVVVGVLLAFLLPMFARARAGRPRRCTTNLKQVALGFNLWAQDYETGFPMEVSESKGGTREAALAGKLLPSLKIISNQMRAPSILICPEDRKRKPAQTFTDLTSLNVSYFLNVDAALSNQNHIIAGDRNLVLAASRVRPGLLRITNLDELQWTNWLHAHGGNVALVDGSAHQVTTKDLRDLLTLGGPTNRLIIP
jgi:prepilin-type N-terminal cleavage/methylation domain-containing protein